MTYWAFSVDRSDAPVRDGRTCACMIPIASALGALMLALSDVPLAWGANAPSSVASVSTSTTIVASDQESPSAALRPAESRASVFPFPQKSPRRALGEYNVEPMTFIRAQPSQDPFGTALTIRIEQQEYLVYITDNFYNARRRIHHVHAVDVNHSAEFLFSISRDDWRMHGDFTVDGRHYLLRSTSSGRHYLAEVQDRDSSDVSWIDELEFAHLQRKRVLDLGIRSVSIRTQGYAYAIHGGNLGKIDRERIADFAITESTASEHLLRDSVSQALQNLTPLVPTLEKDDVLIVSPTWSATAGTIPFHQMHDGVPVASQSRISFDTRTGAVTSLQLRVFPRSAFRRGPPLIAATEARALATATVQQESSVGEIADVRIPSVSELVYRRDSSGEMALVYHYHVVALGGYGYDVQINAQTGTVHVAKLVRRAIGATLPPSSRAWPVSLRASPTSILLAGNWGTSLRKSTRALVSSCVSAPVE